MLLNAAVSRAKLSFKNVFRYLIAANDCTARILMRVSRILVSAGNLLQDPRTSFSIIIGSRDGRAHFPLVFRVIRPTFMSQL